MSQEVFDLLEQYTSALESEEAGAESVDPSEPEAEPAEDLESEEGEDSEVEDPEPEQEAEEEQSDPEPEGEAESEASEERISTKDLLAQIEETRQQQQALMALLLNRQKQEQEPEQKPAADLPLPVVRLALFGGSDSEEWEKLDPVTKAKAQDFAKDYLDRTARYAQDPDAMYRELIRERVLEDLRRELQPLASAFYQQKAESLWEQYASDLRPHKDRIAQVFQQIPGVKDGDMESVEAAFKLAAQLVRAEVQGSRHAEQSRKAEAAERQRKANRRAAKKRAGSAPKPNGKAALQWDGVTPLSVFAEQLAKEGN